jgi:anti-sigma regulatory factor (Ser/Thr protein kinase)
VSVPFRARFAAVHALDLPPTTDSVPAARRFVRRELGAADVDVDTAALLVSEVVTNAVLHARTAVRLSIRASRSEAHIEVRDGSPVEPRVHAFSPTSATGRGLRLLELLAKRWGVRADPRTGGKIVWFDVGEPTDTAWDQLADEWRVEGFAGEH